MRLEDVADLLADYRDCRARIKVLREDMVRAAVETGALPQEEAVKMADKIDVFLDGFLVGQGMDMAWRKVA